MCYRHSAHHKWAHHPKFSHCGPGRWKRKGRFRAGWEYPPANVQEYDDRYELFLFAPGLSKADFQVSVVDQTLIISADPPPAESEDAFHWRRKEFRTRAFKRRFELNDKIDTTGITAEYQDGVLRVTLPKIEGYHTSRQDIDVA